MVKVASPLGRLRSAFLKWQSVKSDGYIIDMVRHGYKLPFCQVPQNTILPNNASARQNPDFVDKEIVKLSVLGCVSRLDQVNPLTVAFSRFVKPRLVLDCR